MTGGTFVYGLLVALAIALLTAAFTDLRRREIDNSLTAGIALAAPLFWWASGLDPWPGMAMQIGLGAAAFLVLAGLFALSAMGGGDVKLLSALALWLPWQPFLSLVIVMSLTGGLLTLVIGAWHVARRRRDKLEIPYGVAIAVAGLWVLGTTYLPASAANG